MPAAPSTRTRSPVCQPRLPRGVLHHARDPELAGDDGGVTELPADVDDERAEMNMIDDQLGSVVGATRISSGSTSANDGSMHDPDDALDDPGADADPR